MADIIVADLQKNIELLAGFQVNELEQLAARLELHEYAADEVVFTAGAEFRSLYLILAGRVQIELVGDVVEETVLAELGPQEVFGESTFFHPAQHNTTARCLEATRLAELPYATYESLLKESSSLAYHLGANAAHILAARLQATDLWIREILDQDQQQHLQGLRQNYLNSFRPSFSTPRGFQGVTHWH